jgi:hypothetical protein
MQHEGQEFCIRIKRIDNLGPKNEGDWVFVETASADLKKVIGKSPNAQVKKGEVTWPESDYDCAVHSLCLKDTGNVVH